MLVLPQSLLILHKNQTIKEVFVVLKKVLKYQEAGIIKTSLIIIIGYIFFHRHNDYHNSLFKMYLEFAGIAISMFGVSLYFVFKTKKQEEDKKKS